MGDARLLIYTLKKKKAITIKKYNNKANVLIKLNMYTEKRVFHTHVAGWIFTNWPHSR